jgi:hypothetical protein
MKIKRFFMAATFVSALTTTVLPQSIITPLFPVKDVFKSASVNYRNIGAAMLAVYIKTVPKPGLCGIHALMTKIRSPENGVKLSDVTFDDMPIAALPLDSTFSDQMFLVNITELVQSREFHGIALRPIKGLSARFTSKEGFPPPSLLVTRDTLNPNPPKWWSAADVPDMSVGKEGDFYVRAAQGVIYRKSPATWDSVASLIIPPEPPAPVFKKTVHRPLKKRI